MSVHHDLKRRAVTAAAATADPRLPHWRAGLPVLHGASFSLRELREDDATALLTMLASEDVSRFLSPPPPTVEGFERFILWTQRERQAGAYICYAVIPMGSDVPVGLIHVRAIEPGFATAEWGFALDSQYWGTGLFAEAAPLVIDFAFDELGAHRLEARAAVVNGRGNGALRKLGAVQEGLLRRSFVRNGQYYDQVLWSILADDWRMQRTHIYRRLVH
jgi:RimJ/RimL family protein N-acetyltransferase